MFGHGVAEAVPTAVTTCMWRVKIKHCTTLNVMPMIPRIRDVTPVRYVVMSCFVTYAWLHGQNACFHTTGRIVMGPGRLWRAVGKDVALLDAAACRGSRIRFYPRLGPALACRQRLPPLGRPGRRAATGARRAGLRSIGHLAVCARVRLRACVSGPRRVCPWPCTSPRLWQQSAISGVGRVSRQLAARRG